VAINLICLDFTILMMNTNKYIILTVLIFFLTLTTSGFANYNNDNFKDKWDKAYKLSKNGQPKSAIKVVEKIYADASDKNNQPEALKALVYMASLESTFKEDYLINTINNFKLKVETASIPEKQILYSLIAELYHAYYNHNRWTINNLKISEGPSDDDISTWDAITFNKVIAKYYFSSLEPMEELTSIPLTEYNAILIHGDTSNYATYPYLFDLLAGRAIEYFASNDYSLATIGKKDSKEAAEFLMPSDRFIVEKIMRNKSRTSAVMSIFQSLLSLHKKNKNIEAFVDIDLKRLKFAYSNSPNTFNDQMEYANALLYLANKFNNQPVYSSIAYELANNYYTMGNGYVKGLNDNLRYFYVIADSICNIAIREYPNLQETNKCRNLKARINNIRFNLDVSVAQSPGKSSLALIEFQNTNKLYFKIVKGDPKAYIDRYNLKNYIERELGKKAIFTWDLELPNTNDHRQNTAEIKIPELETGNYVIFVSDDPNFNTTKTIKYSAFAVSNLSYVFNSNPSGEFNDMFLMDRETGKSAGVVAFNVYVQQYENRNRSYTTKKIASLKTDKNGYAKITSFSGNNYGTFLFEFHKQGDTLFSENYMSFFVPKINNKPRVTTYLFTDRAIYKPGQTVYFKGLVIEKNNSEVKLMSEYSVEVEFINASRKKIDSQAFKTNTNGSFDDFFVIPNGIMNGTMTLKTKSGSITIQVENYKRPTFKTTLTTDNDKQTLDDLILVKGESKGYAGNSIYDATVKYRVIRKVAIPQPFLPNYGRSIPSFNPRNIEIANGSVKTNEEGVFEIRFIAESDPNIPKSYNPVFTYEVLVEVMNLAGEIQTAQHYLNVGYNSVNLIFEVPKLISTTSIDNTFLRSENINGNGIEMLVEITLYKLSTLKGLYNKRRWEKPTFILIDKTEFKNEFPHEVYGNEDDPNTWPKKEVSKLILEANGKTEIPKSLFNSLTIGKYMAVATTSDEKGNEIFKNHFFSVYDKKGKKMPENTISWHIIEKKIAEPGDVVKLIVGTSAPKSRIMYEIINGDKVIDRKWVKLNNGQKIIDIPVMESYRGNFSLNTTMVRYNRLYSNNTIISVPFTNKELEIELETHRDYITPGQIEEWKITVKGSNGNLLISNVFASMYDASLDIFAKNTWGLNLYQNKRTASGWESNQFNSSWSSSLFVPELKYHKPRHKNYPAINWYGFKFMGYNPIYRDESDFMYRKSVIAGGAMETMSSNTLNFEDKKTPLNVNISLPESDSPDIIPIRKNFKETAFFYPNLRTDSSGKVSLKFKTPDALTEWKIRVMAYTNDLKVGGMEKSIKSQKKLMVMPNFPRFVRYGDTLNLSATIVNFSDIHIKAETTIEFYDAVTMKNIDQIIIVNQGTISSNIDPNKSSLVQWTITIPDDVSMLGYRIRTSSGNHTDGEERMVPVLTNRTLVTNSLPMNVAKSSTAVFNFNSLKNYTSPSIANYKYTVEFTSNPSWYAVQALPYISRSNKDNPSELFKRYFANSISAYIMNGNPKLKSVFESWKNLTPDAFISNLEKNQELKDAVLEATPWVLDADNQSEQKRKIGVLFDLNRMKNEKENILNKLIKTQLASGAWPWFNGMRADVNTTQSIVLGMAKLNDKGIIDLSSNPKRLHLVKKAVKFLDEEIVKEYDELKSNYKNNITSYQIRYLYARSLLLELLPLPDNANEAFAYFTTQSKKFWLKQSNYLQGMIAITMNKLGHRNESEAIIRSLKERSLYSKEMGMYWRQEHGWNWYQSPVETQAMMIETMATLDNNPEIVERLKVWLIKQKQTQHWSTTSATAEAIFALLIYGNNSLEGDELVDVTVGEETIDISSNSDISSESGTGYFSTSWTGSDISPEMSNISVINPNNNIAWGAAYWQYFENIENIKSTSSPLDITKTIFIETITNNGPLLVELGEKTLHKGDKVVVRLIIKTDRDIEYIHVKDMRATAFESASSESGYAYKGGLWFYKNITDLGTEFFIKQLKKGTYIIEYPLFVTQSGSFTDGIATIKSMYAQEFGSNSKGRRIIIDE